MASRGTVGMSTEVLARKGLTIMGGGRTVAISMTEVVSSGFAVAAGGGAVGEGTAAV